MKIIKDGGYYDHEQGYRIPMVIECDCGRELPLEDAMTNECECGRFYNGGGQALSHPRHWGEETGERFDDHGGLVYSPDDY